MIKLPARLQNLLIAGLIAIAVFVCFLPTLHNGFVWDDYYNFIGNPNYRGLSTSHLHWIFTTLHDENYHPLLWLTYAFDFVIWGMNPAGYHLTNLVLHVLNAVLFYYLILAFLRQTAAGRDGLRGMRMGGFVGALFFAVHPLRTETVACISIRGELLCGIFYILTIISYVRMNENKAADVRRKWFLLSLLFFMLSLLSKAWGITMPLVLLILDVYPLRRLAFTARSLLSAKKILIEKVPFAVIALAAGIMACLAKKPSMLKMVQHGIVDRFMQATYGLFFYIWKTLLPVRLSPLYLLEKTFNPMEPKYLLCALFVFGTTFGLIMMRHRWPWALAAWTCYAVIISPLLGFVQSGPQLVADRYAYISCMPFGILAGAGVYKLRIAWHEGLLSATTRLLTIATIATGLLVMSVLSLHQARIYHDNLTLWTRAIRIDPGNYTAFNNRGVFYKEHKKDLSKAITDYNAAIALYPEYTGAYYNRALVRDQLGDSAGAMADYSTVIKLDPRHAQAYNNRGILREGQGDLAAALKDFNTAIRLAPFSPEAYANRGMIRLSQNDLQRAIRDFNKVLEIAPAKWSSRVQVEKVLKDIRTRIKKQD